MKLYCYSRKDFNSLMEFLNWVNIPAQGNSTISIANKDEDHWFKNSDYNINLDFDDVSPESWWDNDYYDDSFLMWKNGKDINRFFNNDCIHAMDWNEAERLVKFIDKSINQYTNDIHIHCSAGSSRSQGVVRYILDIYPNINWETRASNPCLTPNYHVVRMLKRIYRYLYE